MNSLQLSFWPYRVKVDRHPWKNNKKALQKKKRKRVEYLKTCEISDWTCIRHENYPLLENHFPSQLMWFQPLMHPSSDKCSHWLKRRAKNYKKLEHKARQHFYFNLGRGLWQNGQRANLDDYKHNHIKSYRERNVHYPAMHRICNN